MGFCTSGSAAKTVARKPGGSPNFAAASAAGMGLAAASFSVLKGAGNSPPAAVRPAKRPARVGKRAVRWKRMKGVSLKTAGVRRENFRSLDRSPEDGMDAGMNTGAILETSHASFAGTISFPEVVRRLVAAGVEYYHVDYLGMRETFYDGTGGMVQVPITYEGMPAVAADFSSEKLRAAILDSQLH